MSLIPSPTQVLVWFDLTASGNDLGPYGVLLEDLDAVLLEDGDNLNLENDVGTGLGFLTLDDPVAGLLDSDYVLAGDIAQDITSYVQSISLNRGRSAQILSDIPAGRWTVRLHNESGIFDPFNPDSPYAGNLVPGKRVQILTDDVVIAEGFIEDWDLFWSVNGKADAQFDCTDALAALAGITLDDWSPTSQLSGARIAAILDRPEVDWNAGRDIDTGAVTLQADTVTAGTNALNYAQLVARTEGGKLYATRLGDIRFQDRAETLAEPGPVAFRDDGTGTPYRRIQVTYGSEQLFNVIELQRIGGTLQTATDPTSVDRYRRRTFTASGLLHNTDESALDSANWLLTYYSSPVIRFSSITVDLADDRITPAMRADIVGLDIGDAVTVEFQPTSTATPIERWAAIEGVDHSIEPDRHTITLHLGYTIESGTFLLLDDDVFGLLDNNVLGF
jgi:hypothetical protein